MTLPDFEYSEAHKKIVSEGFNILGMYMNASFGTQERHPSTPPLLQIIEEKHMPFRILPAHIAINNAPAGYEERHMIYVPGGFHANPDLMGCACKKRETD